MLPDTGGLRFRRHSGSSTSMPQDSWGGKGGRQLVSRGWKHLEVHAFALGTVRPPPCGLCLAKAPHAGLAGVTSATPLAKPAQKSGSRGRMQPQVLKGGQVRAAVGMRVDGWGPAACSLQLGCPPVPSDQCPHCLLGQARWPQVQQSQRDHSVSPTFEDPLPHWPGMDICSQKDLSLIKTGRVTHPCPLQGS